MAYKQMRLPLMLDPANRESSASVDAKLVNCVIEKVNGVFHVKKRPGVGTPVAPATGAGRGLHNWNGTMYSVIGTNLYKGATLVNAVSAPSYTVASSPPLYFFEQTQGTPKLFLQGGAKARSYTYDGTTFAAVTSAGFPTTDLVPGTVYLDGYVCVMDTAGRIYQSAIDDPTTWSGDYLTAEIEPDDGVWIAKHLNYIVALGGWTTQFFYDAANATGSPFAPFQGSTLQMGCYGGVADLNGTLYWVATSRQGGLFVVSLEQDKPMRISTPAVERLLENAGAPMIGFGLQTSGHTYYVLTGLGTNPLTIAYDTREKLWYEWNTTGSSYWPYIASAYGGADPSGTVYVQNYANGGYSLCSDASTTDNGTNIISDIYTPLFDGGTNANKAQSSLELIGDKQTGSVMSVSWSDDDYTTWSTARTVDMSVAQSITKQLGTFRRRAFHLQHSGSTGFRLESAEIHVQPGTT